MSLPVRICIHLVILTCVYNNAVKGTADTEGSKVTIDAALSFKSRTGIEWVYLYVGNMVRGIGNKRDFGAVPRISESIPDDFPLQAAFVKDPLDREASYFYGDKYGYLTYPSGTTQVRKLKYGPKRKFIRNGGPDAAGRRNGIVYFFKGCKIAIRHSWKKWELAVNDVETIGLPCNVDAAWGEAKGAMVVLKGDEFWRWETDDSVNGPHVFRNTYELKDWVLKPSSETK